MAPQKAIDGKDAPTRATPVVTARTYARAAIIANLSVATLVFVEFGAMAIVDHDVRPFRTGLWLVPFVTLVVWGAAAVIFVGAAMPGWLRLIGRRLAGASPTSRSGRSGVWDDWLDNPEPHGR